MELFKLGTSMFDIGEIAAIVESGDGCAVILKAGYFHPIREVSIIEAEFALAQYLYG